MSLIEKIARAIHRVDAAKGHDYDKMDCVLKARFEHIAQAALTAIMGEGDGVQECDREAAQAIYNGESIFAQAGVKARDGHELVQAFARHRSTAAAAERARSAAKLRAAADQFDMKGWETEWAIADGLRELAAEIERGVVIMADPNPEAKRG